MESWVIGCFEAVGAAFSLLRFGFGLRLNVKPIPTYSLGER